jgi:hypothetical protein
MTSTTNRRKILIPLATLLAAGAVAVGSGATFTSTSVSSSAVTSGTLVHTNSRDGLSMNVENIKPGDSISGTATISNTGSLDSTLTLQETGDTSTFVAGDLKLVIAQGTTELYNGNFGALDNSTLVNLGALNKAQSTTITFTVSMPSAAGDANQGKQASASYRWVTTQSGTSSPTLSWG